MLRVGEGVEGNHPKESRDSGIMGELADVISLVDPEVLIRAAASVETTEPKSL